MRLRFGTLETRILDDRSRQRHAGGSPDENEIAAYAAALPSPPIMERR